MNAGLDRARDELAAAQLLIDNDLLAQAVSCAFQAARHAAEAALLVLGEARSEPAQVVPAGRPAAALAVQPQPLRRALLRPGAPAGGDDGRQGRDRGR